MTSKDQISEVVRLLQEARRPVFIWGAGIRSSAQAGLDLARSLGIPVACTWGAIDLVHHDDPLMAGGFGTHGTRAANFAVQNSDLIISIGSRLDTKSTGQPSSFARGARIVMVDIDQAEINKFSKLGRKIDIGLCMDAGEFMHSMLHEQTWYINLNWKAWVDQIRDWRDKYDTPKVTWPGINPYEFMKELGKYTTKDDILCSDTGTALGYMMQGFPFKGERFVHAFNMTPMGYGLPAAIGASLATSQKVVLVAGDGSLMMSLSELATVTRWNLNIKIILLNNGQHSMCVQTEKQWFGGRNVSTTVESGLAFPDWDYIPDAFGIDHAGDLDQLFGYHGPSWFELKVHKDARLLPQSRFGFPIEDQEPSLSREELRQQMMVPLCSISEALSIAPFYI